VFGNRVLRRIFGPKREEVVAGCRRLHNEELHNLYTSLNITRVIKSRRIRWERRVARMGETIFYLENLNGRDRCEDLGIDVKIILEWF
jgi:hypothetical protein